jgi:hypothetical protein
MSSLIMPVVLATPFLILWALVAALIISIANKTRRE